MIEQMVVRKQQPGFLGFLKSHSPLRQQLWLNVLVVPQQGVYDKDTKKFHCEHADRGIYRKHLQEIPQIVRSWRCNCVGMTGGCTQKALPNVSEARGAVNFLNDIGVDVALRQDRVILEEAALDSAENLMFTLMLARLRFPRIPIGHVVIWPAWSFKMQRFNMAARACGILEQTYLYGGFGAECANAGEAAASGERDQLAQMLEKNDPLLLGEKWDLKRRTRYQGSSYKHRLDHLRPFFPCCFAALDEMRANGTKGDTLERFQASFRAEVIGEATSPL